MRGTRPGRGQQRRSGARWRREHSQRVARRRSPGWGLGWTAGVVGLLVAGRLLLRRAPVPVESGPPPVPWPPRSFDLEPVWWPDGEASPPATERLTREDVASQQEDEALDRAAPRIRRGPSGREHFWLEPGPSSRG